MFGLSSHYWQLPSICGRYGGSGLVGQDHPPPQSCCRGPRQGHDVVRKPGPNQHQFKCLIRQDPGRLIFRAYPRILLRQALYSSAPPVNFLPSPPYRDEQRCLVSQSRLDSLALINPSPIMLREGFSLLNAGSERAKGSQI